MTVMFADCLKPTYADVYEVYHFMNVMFSTCSATSEDSNLSFITLTGQCSCMWGGTHML